MRVHEHLLHLCPSHIGGSTFISFCGRPHTKSLLSGYKLHYYEDELIRDDEHAEFYIHEIANLSHT